MYYYQRATRTIRNNIEHMPHGIFITKIAVEFQNILISLICIKAGEKDDGNIIQTSKVKLLPIAYQNKLIKKLFMI